MGQGVGSHGIFHFNRSNSKDSRDGIMVGSCDFGGFGSDRFQFLHNPPMIMDKEQRFVHGFDNGCKRVKLTCNQGEINAPVEPTSDLSSGEDEDSYPLGLKLRKTPSFLDLVEMKLSQGRLSGPGTTQSISPVVENMNNEDNAAQPTSEKLKASNFAAKRLRIGTWERVSMYEGDLVAKCYYAKRKLVWEVLNRGLKSKIEIQWSDITALKATFLANQPGILEVELCHPPVFFRETNPQPRKHTLWQSASDFTGGQALICRRHFLQFPEGTLEKHYEKLLQCDVQLSLMSQKPFPSSSFPYFESYKNSYQDHPYQMNDHRPEFVPGFLHIAPSNYSPLLHNFSPLRAILPDPRQQVQQIPKFESFRATLGAEELNSPNSVFDLQSPEDTSVKLCGEQKMRSLGNGNYMEEFGSRRILQIQEMDSTIGNHMTSSHYPQDCNLPLRYSYSLLPSEAGVDGFSSNKSVLDDIAKHLLNDQLVAICSDEQKVIKKINSMCSLIDGASLPDSSTDLENSMEQTSQQNSMNNSALLENPDQPNLDGGYGLNLTPIEQSSAENPLMYLPQIASFPTFFLDEIDVSATGEADDAWNQWRWQC